MANLKFNEKQLFEKLFDRGGYVLNFSNRTFEEFFKDFNILIYSDKYSFNGDSKMKRLRAFWEIETDVLVGKVLMSLLEYADSVEGINEKDKNLALSYLNKLIGVSKQEKNNELSEEDFLKKEYQELDISLLSLGIFTQVIEQRLLEIQKCFKSNAFLSVVFLCGSTLEGILLNLATQKPRDFNTAKSAPKDKNQKVKKLPEWSLSSLIDVAYENGHIGLHVKKYSHALRDFRNFIHPFEQYSNNFIPGKHTAKISWQVLQAVIDDLITKKTN